LTAGQEKSIDAGPASKENNPTTSAASKDQARVDKQGSSKEKEIVKIKMESDADQSPAKKKRKRGKKGKEKVKDGVIA